MMRVRLETFAKYAGFATVAVEWSALYIYYVKMPLYFGGKYPISFFATLPETKWVFSTCYLFAAICCWIFTKHHLTKYYKIPLKVFGVSLFLFAATGIFPYDPSSVVSSVIHTVLALSSGLLFVGGLFVLARHAKDRLLFNITAITIVVSLCLTGAFLLSLPDGHLVFSFEVGSWLALQLWMIWISFYVRGRQKVAL